jgi:ABC1 atypical kinase-like domain
MNYSLYNLSRSLLMGVAITLSRRLPWRWAKYLGQNVTHLLGGIGQKLQQFTDMQSITLGDPLHGLPRLVKAPGAREVIFCLCPSLEDELDILDEKALQGSIAQVVRARLKSGEWVALKIHRTGVTKAIQSDSDFLRHGMRAMHSMRKGFDVYGYSNFFSGELQGELDFGREAAIQDRLHRLASKEAQYVIPKPIQNWITPQLLTMTWETSQPLVSALGLNEMERDILLLQLSEAILDALFTEHILIADLNPGNVGWRPGNGSRDSKPRLILYDFGSAIELPASQVDGFKLLLHSVKQGTDPVPALVLLGFDTDKLALIGDLLPAYLRLLLSPLISDFPFHLESWQRKENAQALLGERRWLFMQAAPPELFALMRCLYGWLHWHRVLQRPFQAGSMLFKKLNAGTDSHSQPIHEMTQPSATLGLLMPKSVVTTQLHIQVSVQGNSRVKMTLPGHCASMLADLMDPDIRSQIEDKGIDIVQISQNAIESGFAAGDLFRVEDSRRSVHIFLA